MSYVVAALATFAAGLAVALGVFMRREALGQVKAAELELANKAKAHEMQVEENDSIRRRYDAQIKDWRERVLELEDVIAECDSPSARRALVLGLLSKSGADNRSND